MVDPAIAEFGRVDVLVSNAGIGTAVPAARETADEFCAVVDINLNGCYWAAQACGGAFVTGRTIDVDGGVTVA
jgi:NAD(P)-dependent dehydrogenase (short-subunit alcohol dehydrogenase family)